MTDQEKDERDWQIAQEILAERCPFGEYDKSTESCKYDYFDCLCVNESKINPYLKEARERNG
jgi:hypothetical protein